MAGITRIHLLSIAGMLGWVGLAAAQQDVADIPSRQVLAAGDPNLGNLLGPAAAKIHLLTILAPT